MISRRGIINSRGILSFSQLHRKRNNLKLYCFSGSDQSHLRYCIQVVMVVVVKISYRKPADSSLVIKAYE
jgi:hypothetical protein